MSNDVTGNLVLIPEDEILNATETSFDDRKVVLANSNCFILTISLIIICFLLLVVICVSCYFYYTKYRLKQLLPFHGSSIKSGKHAVKIIL